MIIQIVNTNGENEFIDDDIKYDSSYREKLVDLPF